jgi:hypothetical protein
MTSAEQFFHSLPFTPPLFTTAKGDAAAHLVSLNDDTVSVSWLASIQRGAGRAAMTTMIEAADRHGVTLELTAKPQPPSGDGKKMTRAKLEAFYAGFGFVTAKRINGFAHMARTPTLWEHRLTARKDGTLTRWRTPCRHSQQVGPIGRGAAVAGI